MRTSRNLSSGLLLGSVVMFAPAALLAAAKVSSDLTSPQKRQAIVDVAEKLAHRPPVKALPADQPSPFNPKDFDKPDPSEAPPTAGTSPATPATPSGDGSAPTPAKPAGPTTDRETLETLATQITPSGVIMLRGSSRLIIANRPFEVGTRFTATYNGQDYELELVSIDRTTFTLRYRGEEITRPIKPVR